MSRLALHAGGTQPEHDQNGDHAEFERGLCQIVGNNWRGLPTMPKRTMPWPQNDSRGRLVWLVRQGHQPWFPTIAERDATWMDTHQEGYEAMQQQQLRIASIGRPLDRP